MNFFIVSLLEDYLIILSFVFKAKVVSLFNLDHWFFSQDFVWIISHVWSISQKINLFMLYLYVLLSLSKVNFS